MRTRKIERVVKLSTRAVVWLACNHKVSIRHEAMVQYPGLDDLKWFMCPFCPDPVPEVTRLEKTPQQLWKEAGEP